MRGGKRPGAGRKKGSLSILNRKTAEVAAEKGITPLEVELITMRALWDAAHGKPATFDLEKAKEAMVVADRAAPYCHARITAVAPPAPPPPEFEDEREVGKRAVFLLRREEADLEREVQKQIEPPKKKVKLA